MKILSIAIAVFAISCQKSKDSSGNIVPATTATEVSSTCSQAMLKYIQKSTSMFADCTTDCVDIYVDFGGCISVKAKGSETSKQDFYKLQGDVAANCDVGSYTVCDRKTE